MTLVALPLDARPSEAGDRDAGKARGAARLERSGRNPTLLFPAAAAVMVAADVDERRPERVGEEGQPLRRQVAAADHAVEVAEGASVDLLLERPVDLVGRGEEADRAVIAIGERPPVRPADPDAADHGGS